MTELSPAAQAVLDGFRAVPSLMDGPSIAGALRAAADQVLPEQSEPPCGEGEPWPQSYQLMADSKWEQRQKTRAELLTIAAELEGDGPAVSADREPASVVPKPTDKELCETYVAAYYATKNRQGPAAQAAGLRAVLKKWGVQ